MVDYEALRARLHWYDIRIIQQLEDDEDSNGEPIERWDCKKDGESVTVEYYTSDDQVDIYYTCSGSDIYYGNV